MINSIFPVQVSGEETTKKPQDMNTVNTNSNNTTSDHAVIKVESIVVTPELCAKDEVKANGKCQKIVDF